MDNIKIIALYIDNGRVYEYVFINNKKWVFVNVHV